MRIILNDGTAMARVVDLDPFTAARYIERGVGRRLDELRTAELDRSGERTMTETAPKRKRPRRRKSAKRSE